MPCLQINYLQHRLGLGAFLTLFAIASGMAAMILESWVVNDDDPTVVRYIGLKTVCVLVHNTKLNVAQYTNRYTDGRVESGRLSDVTTGWADAAARYDKGLSLL